MKVKALVAFKTKLSTPCRKLLVLLRLKKPLYTRSRVSPRPSDNKPQVCALFPIFRSSRKKSKEMTRVKELKNTPETGREKLIPTMPIPPASSKKTVSSSVKKPNAVVEEACRSFENYLLEMIVEEGNVKDLMDVKSCCIVGRTSNPQSLLSWYLGSMESYVKTCFHLKIPKTRPKRISMSALHISLPCVDEFELCKDFDHLKIS